MCFGPSAAGASGFTLRFRSQGQLQPDIPPLCTHEPTALMSLSVVRAFRRRKPGWIFSVSGAAHSLYYVEGAFPSSRPSRSSSAETGCPLSVLGEKYQNAEDAHHPDLEVQHEGDVDRVGFGTDWRRGVCAGG